MSSRRKFSGMRFVGLGMEFAAAVAGLTLLGHWLDSKYGWEPWGLLIGAAVGLVGGMYNMIKGAMSAVRPPVSNASREGADSSSVRDPNEDS